MAGGMHVVESRELANIRYIKIYVLHCRYPEDKQTNRLADRCTDG